MDEILLKANELGLLIKKTGVYIEFLNLNKEVENDNGASLLLKKYNEIAETIQQRQAGGVTLEKFEQERFREISAAVATNQLLVKYLKARDRYMELLTSIHNALSGDTRDI